MSELRWTELVTLMDAEAAKMEAENRHSAAILLRAGAEEIRRNHAPVRQKFGLGSDYSGGVRAVQRRS